MRELQKAKEKETEINERIRVGGDYYETHRADRRESARRAGGLGSSPVSGRSPGEGDGNPLQYSCLEDPMAMGWQSRTPLSNFTFTLGCSDEILDCR